MGHNRKRIASYNKERADEQKKKAASKKNKIIAIVAAVVVVAIIAAIVGVVIYNNRTVTVVMKVKDYGTIVLELYPGVAPKTVENFLKYVDEGFYNGLTFHRVIDGFMIQGGDPTGTGIGDPSLETIVGEFSANGYKNDLSFERGVIGMARTTYNSASSQFFICHEDSTHLDGEYAAFGRVVEGIEVVDNIAACDKTSKVDENGTRYEPAEKIIIEEMYIAD